MSDTIKNLIETTNGVDQLYRKRLQLRADIENATNELLRLDSYGQTDDKISAETSTAEGLLAGALAHLDAVQKRLDELLSNRVNIMSDMQKDFGE